MLRVTLGHATRAPREWFPALTGKQPAALHDAADAANRKSQQASASEVREAGSPLLESTTEIESITREAALAGSCENPAGDTRKS